MQTVPAEGNCTSSCAVPTLSQALVRSGKQSWQNDKRWGSALLPNSFQNNNAARTDSSGVCAKFALAHPFSLSPNHSQLKAHTKHLQNEFAAASAPASPGNDRTSQRPKVLSSELRLQSEA